MPALREGDAPARRARAFEFLVSRLSDSSAETARSKLGTFQLLFVLAVTAEAWSKLLALDPPDPRTRFVAGTSLALLIAFGLSRLRRAVLGGFLLLVGVQISRNFPLTGNHIFLVAFVLLLLTVFDREVDEECRCCLVTLKLLFAIVIFQAGMQKLLHGYYFQGQLLAFFATHYASFNHFFAVVLPESDLAALAGFANRVGDGPYRLQSWLGLALANLTYVSEILLPIGLMFRRTRTASVLLLLGLVLAIELAAREFFFGLLFTYGLLLFAQRDWNRRLLPSYLLLYAWLLSMRLHLLPPIEFS